MLCKTEIPRHLLDRVNASLSGVSSVSRLNYIPTYKVLLYLEISDL